MVIRSYSIRHLPQGPAPGSIEELLQELGHFSKDGSVKLIYSAAENDTEVQFNKIVSGLELDFSAIADFEKSEDGEDAGEALEEIMPKCWDVELDGDVLGSCGYTPEDSLQDALRLCYQVSFLRSAREQGASESEMDELDRDLSEERVPLVELRQRLLNEFK